jgi:DNA (cytosine-5)-methyltransferase 1
VYERLTAVDLFAGAGGTTQGLKDAGYRVLAAIENDRDAAASYVANHPEARLYERDIRRVQAPAFGRRLGVPQLDLVTACPPCQGFSTLGDTRDDDPRNDLVSSVTRFVGALAPRAVLMENVPGLATDPRFRSLIASLQRNYVVTHHIAHAEHFGVPQRRRRVIVLAISKELHAGLPESLAEALPADFDASRQTAGPALERAKHLDSTTDPLHRSRRSSPVVLARIRASRQGGGRADLPPSLQLACHAKLGNRAATTIYGRIDPSEPAPTMTTRCTTPSCGRFIHPYEDRGLTLREAALLQTFPLDYKFVGSYGSIERQIGNAVPVRLGHALGEIVRSLLEQPTPHRTTQRERVLAA